MTIVGEGRGRGGAARGMTRDYAILITQRDSANTRSSHKGGPMSKLLAITRLTC